MNSDNIQVIQSFIKDGDAKRAWPNGVPQRLDILKH